METDTRRERTGAEIKAMAWNALEQIADEFCDGDFEKAYESIPATRGDSITEHARKTVEFAEWLGLDLAAETATEAAQ